MAALAGLIVSATSALGRMARFRACFLQRRVQEVMDSSGWRSKTGFSEEVREEFRSWVERTDDLNDQLIRKSLGVKVKVQVVCSSDAGATMLRERFNIQ